MSSCSFVQKYWMEGCMLARTNFFASQTPFIGRISCVTPGPPTSLWFQRMAAQDVSTSFILCPVISTEWHSINMTTSLSLILCYGELYLQFFPFHHMLQSLYGTCKNAAWSQKHCICREHLGTSCIFWVFFSSTFSLLHVPLFLCISSATLLPWKHRRYCLFWNCSCCLVWSLSHTVPPLAS